MKKKNSLFFRIVAMVLALAAVLSLSACGGNNNPSNTNSGGGQGDTPGKTYNGIDVSEHLNLKMILIGDRTPDFDEVYGKINEILEEKLNCSLSVEFLSWGEHDTKYSMKFSSQEDFDIIFTAAGWCHYEQTVAMNGFYELTPEFIQKYAPGVWELLPPIAWSQASVNGKIYMVPNYSTEFSQDVCAVRGDLLEEFGMDTIASFDDMVQFGYKCAEKGMFTAGAPFWQFFQSKGMATTNGAPNGGELVLYNTQDPNDTKFYYLLDWDGYSEYCHLVKDMVDAGCWSKDILNSTAERQDGLLNGRDGLMVWNMGSCKNFADQANKAHPEWKVTICDPQTAWPKRVNAYTNNGVALNIFGKHQERAMMVINEFFCDPAIQDLASLGIEGKHWKAVGDDQYEIIDESGYGVDSNCNWGWNNENIKRKEYIPEKTELDLTFDAMQESWKQNMKAEHVLDGFVFDNSNVTTQVAAVEAAMAQYYGPLNAGISKDVDADLANLRQALEQAGIQTILDEMNAQAQAFIAARNG